MSLTEKELRECEKVVKQALDVLGKKNLVFIMHAPSFPSEPYEDTGTGLLTSEGAKELISFIEKLGYNSIQLGPDGKTKENDASPYVGTIFSANPLLINLQELTMPEWGEILKTETFDEIVKNNPNKGKNKLAYRYIMKKQQEALLEVYSTFKTKLAGKDEKIVKLNRKFNKFKKENSDWLEKDALYEALSIKHKNDYFPVWKDALDRELFGKFKDSEEAKARIAEIEKTYSDEIEYYRFIQFVAGLEKEKIKKYTIKHGIKTMADVQVAFSDRDYWANKALFLEGYLLGAPPDFFTKNGQTWGFPVLNPEKVFNKDGSPGEAGELLYKRFYKVFSENPGGARIDHAVGLIDPWVYKAGKTARGDAGARRLYSSPDSKELKRFSHIGMECLNTYRDVNASDVAPEELDEILPYDCGDRVKWSCLENPEIFKKYSGIVEIVLKAANDAGVDKEQIIFEDLGAVTNPVVKVMNDFKLSGIRVIQFVNPYDPEHIYRGKNIDKRHWVTAGTHDNIPLLNFIAGWYKDKDCLNAHVNYLAEDLASEEDKEAFVHRLKKDPKELFKAKMVELFTSPAESVQIFFTDIFGLDEPYNVPGTSGDKNWSLRLPYNYKQVYFSSIKQNKGVNMPEILETAIKAKGINFVSDLNCKYPELLSKLDKYAIKLRNI